MNRRTFLFGGAAIAGAAILDRNLPSSNVKKVEKIVKVTSEVKPIEAVAIKTARPDKNYRPEKHWPTYKHRPATKVRLSSYDHAVLVKTIWGETRGESKLGRMAVVHVILNRIHTKNPIYKSYKNVAQVCLRKYQFSCWLDKLTMRHIKVDDTFKEIKHQVDEAIRSYEHGIDYSNGALLYYSDIIDPPKWASSYNQVNKIGLHNFFA